MAVVLRPTRDCIYTAIWSWTIAATLVACVYSSALGRRLRVQVPGCGSFSPVATFKLCS